jgi:predicted ArsR family transcriptional regulator
MSTRSPTETITLLLQAFLRQRTWAQAALARDLGLSVRTVRQHLFELEAAGVPLEREEEPPSVWWSVPRGWFPGGAFVAASEARQIARRSLGARRT